MKSVYDRTTWLVGAESMEKIKQSRVIVFGVGGVGGFVIEALARTGVGHLSIVDYDTIDITNINRQIIALHSTVGAYKVEVMTQRIWDINPSIRVHGFRDRLTDETINSFHLETQDYIVDAIDDTRAKILLIERAKMLGVPVISSMGTGNKMDPSRFRISDIGKTHTCPLAKKIRKACADRDIQGVKVLFSDELPSRQAYPETGQMSPASIAFAPAAAGILIAGEVIRDLMDEKACI